MAVPLLKPVYTGTPRFVDSTGQRILLRGVNVQAGAASSIYQRAVSMGANMVRISIHWGEGEPTAPQGSGTNWASYSHTYAASFLDAVEAMVTYYGQNGVFVQIDSHQAGWATVAPFNGFGGIPNWYYTDSRFPGAQTLSGSCAGAANKAGCAIASWWTSTAERGANQTFYKAWWAELVRRFSAHPNVIMYQPFNEPNPGAMTGTSQAKTDTMHTWLVPIVDAIRAADPDRAIAIMNRGGGEGYGTVTYQAFGGSAGLIQRKMVIEHHSYYTGLAPGFPANPSISGQVGYDAAGDDRVPNDAAALNTTANSSYHGALQYQENYYSVPISKAAQMGVPLFLGEFGVHAGDPGRLAYISQTQQMIDAHELDGTVWLLADTGGNANSLNLVTSGSLNDMGTAWSNWFKATDFTPASGGGGSTGGGGGGASISTSPIAAGQLPNFYDPTWTSGSHKGRVEDILEVNGVTYVAGAFGHVIDVDGTDYGVSGANDGPYAFLAAFRSDTGALMKSWAGDIDGRVRRIKLAPDGGALIAVGDFDLADGQARSGIFRVTLLPGPTSGALMNVEAQPGDVNADGPIYDFVFNAAGTSCWVIGGFSNISGVARRGIAKYNISGGTWTLDTAFNAGRAAFVAGGTGRCLALKPDGTKLVAGWFPGNNGTDVSAHASLSAHDPATGASMTWTNTANYTTTNAEHPGAFEMAGDANGVYVCGLYNGGNTVIYLNWNGSGPNTLTVQAGTSDGTSIGGYWYHSSDGNCQALALGNLNNVPVVFCGHHGDVVAVNKNTPSGGGATQTSHGLFTCIAGPSGGGLAGYGGPPNFSSPNLSSGAATGDPLKLWAIYQAADGDLLVGGDFTAVNTSAANSYQRYARFNATSAPTGWSPTPTLSDPTPQVGETISVDPGTLAGATGYTYQWQTSPDGASGWQDISAATAQSYTVQSSDTGAFLRAQVTGTLTAGGTQTAYATASGAVQPQGSAPVNTGTPPAISPSSGVTVGTTLTASTSGAQWTPSTGLTFSYQWQRKNLSTGAVSDIPGATSASYTAVTADDGSQLRAVVTATQTSTGLTGTAPTAFVTVGTQQTSAVIWYVADMGSSAAAQTNVQNNIPQNGAGVDLIVLGGDFYPRGTSADLSADITALFGPSGKNCLNKVVIQEGNHDWPNRDCAGAFRAYKATLPKMAGMSQDGIGKITLAGVDLIFLATDAAATGVVGDCTETTATVTDAQSGLGANQLAQLTTWMQAPGTRKIVFSHKQRYSCGANHGDISQLADMWSALQPAKYGGNGGTLIHFHGHEHNYQRMRPRDAGGLIASDAGFQGPGVIELCNGCGGEGNYNLNTAYPAKYIAKFRGSSTTPQYGMARITITGDTLQVDAFDDDGVTIYDSVTLTMTGATSGGSGPTGGTPTFTNLSGAPAVGDTLVADSGTWAGSGPMTFVFTIQHSLDNGATWQTASGTGAQQTISGQSDGNAQASYVVDSSDQGALLRARVVVSNSLGSATGFTAATAAVATVGTGRPVLVTAPSVSPTNPLVGTTLACTTGAWTDPTGSGLTFTYDWKVYSPGTGAVTVRAANAGPSYTAQPGDTGLRIFCTVTATNSAGSISADSQRTAAVSSTQIVITDEIDTVDAQTIPEGTPFTVVWESHTTAPGGVTQSQIRLDNGPWLNGQKIQDDGAGGGVWQYTFQTLPVGTHTIDTQDIAQG